MKKHVVKFGGSNLRRPGDLDRIAAIVRSYDRPLVLVVSAFYGITNELVAAVEAAKAGAGRAAAPSETQDYTRGLRSLHRDILEANLPDAGHRIRVQAAVETRLDQLDRYLTGIHYIGDVPPFVYDAVLSYGERLSSLIVAQVLASRGLDAREFLPEDLGLLTDGSFGNATCDFAASAGPVSRALAGAGIAVVPGFYGVDRDGRTTLFGRGGSDYSAASIARCVGAESLDVWKDVDGFLSGDPSVVSQPRSIGHLHYLEAAELSYFGAKILHPRTVEPLFDQNIPIRILNINAPDRGLEPYTVVDGRRPGGADPVKSVASSDDVGVLKLHGPGVGFKAGILAQVTGTLDRLGINIKSVITAQTAINLLLAAADLDPAWSALQGHHVAGVVDVTRNPDVSIVAVVGPGTALASRALNTALEEGLEVTLAAAGASEVAAYFLVRRADRDRAVRLVHREFFPG
jgi:aspartate kinase/aspartokinase/homoserine dehydrogenase 1